MLGVAVSHQLLTCNLESLVGEFIMLSKLKCNPAERVTLCQPLSETNTYGCWHAKKDGTVFVPELLCGSDYSGNLVNRSNNDEFMEQFSDGNGKWWTEVSGGHGTFAIVIDLATIPDEEKEHFLDFFDDLENYPSANDDRLSELGIESQYEAWQSWAKDEFIREVEKQHGADISEREDLFNLFCMCSDMANEYWLNEEGPSSHIDVAKVARKFPTMRKNDDKNDD
jgi:hypothetical protein